MNSKQSAGGKANGIILRKESLERYYSSPNICLFCNNVILVKDNQQVSEVRKKKFCNHSCAAQFNNKHRVLNKNSKFGKSKTSNCQICNTVINLKKYKNGSYLIRKFCDSCLPLGKARSRGVDDIFINLTKGYLYSRRQDWGSANSSIRTHSREVYLKSDLPKCCKICGYDKHIEVCHIKQVKDFSDESLISEINCLDNLVALCPNHHWEFDNKLISII